MERSTPVRQPHPSTADLLTWTETPQPADRAAGDSAPQGSRRTNKPASGITPVMFGGPMCEEEAASVLKSFAKPCSGYKLKEITRSGIFVVDSENGASESVSAAANPNNLTGLCIYQQAVSGISQISFSADDESVSPKKPTTLPEVVKQQEFSGSLQSELDATMKKQFSEAKCKELSGHGVFGPPPKVPLRPEVAKQRELSGSVESELDAKMKKKQFSEAKCKELSGHDIFGPPPRVLLRPQVAKQRELSGSLESGLDANMKKQFSEAKCKELSGHDIFGPPPDVPLRPLAARNLELKGHLDFGEPAPWNAHTSVKVSNPSGSSSDIMFGEVAEVKTTKKIHNHNFQELMGDAIFNGEVPRVSVEKLRSVAKLREMSGSDIFSDGKAKPRAKKNFCC